MNAYFAAVFNSYCTMKMHDDVLYTNVTSYVLMHNVIICVPVFSGWKPLFISHDILNRIMENFESVMKHRHICCWQDDYLGSETHSIINHNPLQAN